MDAIRRQEVFDCLVKQKQEGWDWIGEGWLANALRFSKKETRQHLETLQSLGLIQLYKDSLDIWWVRR